MIKKYFKQDFILFRKQTSSDRGVIKDSLQEIQTFKGILDKRTSVYNFEREKGNYITSFLLFCPADIPIKEDDIIEHDSVKYNVRSVINPFYRNNHLEVTLEYLK